MLYNARQHSNTNYSPSPGVNRLFSPIHSEELKCTSPHFKNLLNLRLFWRLSVISICVILISWILDSKVDIVTFFNHWNGRTCYFPYDSINCIVFNQSIHNNILWYFYLFIFFKRVWGLSWFINLRAWFRFSIQCASVILQLS